MNTVEAPATPSTTPQHAGAISEVISCMGLGIRDGMRPRLALTSVFAMLLAFGFWLLVFLIWRTEIWNLLGEFTRWVLAYCLGLSGSSPASGGWAVTATGAVLNFLLMVGLFLLLVMLSIRIYLELFLMRRVQQQCLPHYPSLVKGVKGSLRADLQSTLAQFALLCVGVLLLVIPVVGGIVFFLLASYLNVRGLINDALEDLATLEERRIIVRKIRTHMLLLGVAATLLLLIPLAGLFIPAILGASVCHLCMRALTVVRSAAEV